LYQYKYNHMKDLTKAEEQIMRQLWQLKKAFVKDIIERLPEPKPAYNTVSTIVRILEKKGFVGHEAFGKSHQYYALVPEDSYKKHSLKHLMQNYFGGSFKQMASFFAKEENLSLDEMEEVLSHVKDDLNKKK
jgi:BlaI family penicillinase repressor